MARTGAVVLLFIILQTRFASGIALAQSQGEILFMSDQDGNREIYVIVNLQNNGRIETN